MAGAAPDATSLLHLTSPAANDAALKALLASAAGKNFRVGPEHFLAKSAGDTAIVSRPRILIASDVIRVLGKGSNLV